MFGARNFFLTAARAVIDPLFDYVTLLLTGNGTNGAQNNTFLDSSTNNFTITRNGNTTQGTFTPYGSNWSNYFDGSGDSLAVTSATAFDFSADFTVEGWFNFSQINQVSGATVLFSTDVVNRFQLNTLASGNVIQFYENSGTASISVSNPIVVGTWNHIALVRTGTTIGLFVNGSRIGSYTSSFSFDVGVLYIGQQTPGYSNHWFNGYASNVRVIKGSGPYNATQSTLTVPASPLTAITNTSLLTCQSNRFIDNSTNAFTITVNGETSVQRFSPFNPTAPYAAGTDGGSGYFDGSGDYLTTPTSSQFTASGNFTVSCWFMLNSFANSYYVVGGNWDAGTSDEWLIQIQNNGAIRFLTSASTSFSSSGVVKLNEWTFFSATRSGSTVTVQVNGTTVSTYTKSDTLGSATKSINIGQQPGNNWPWNGYISDFRLVSGSAVTTLPTSPLTAISGTGLLLNFTNAGIIDNAEMNNLETVGNAQISTAQSKFGGGSMYFDGSGARAVCANTPNFAFGTGNFTLEFWINFANLSSYQTIYSYGYTTSGDLLIQTGNGNGRMIVYVNGSAVITESGTASTGTWIHYALVRNGTTLTLYRDGTSSGSATNSTDINTADIIGIGANPLNYGGNPPGSAPFNGYIDDLRITKYARYTANFTPPAAPFPLS